MVMTFTWASIFRQCKNLDFTTAEFMVFEIAVFIFHIVLSCWTLSCGHSGQNLLQREQQTLLAWSKTVMRLDFPRWQTHTHTHTKLHTGPKHFGEYHDNYVIVYSHDSLCSSALAVFVSGSQSVLCWPSRERKTLHTQWSLEGHH